MNDQSRIESRRKLFREQYSSVVFNSYLNLLLEVVFFIASLTYATINISWNLYSPFLISAFFIFAEAIMYATHRWQQHRKMRFSHRIFEMHSKWHHGMFSNARMHVESMKDMNMVILPFFVHGFVVYIIYLPVALLIESLLHSDIGWILLFSVTLQLIWYEIVHTASHLKSPPSFFSKLAIHHQVHHNAGVMSSSNFGIGTTIFDRLFGTYHDR